MPVDFYNNVLYPLQNRVLEAFRDTPFYLTGGTALSRGYYRHRYSDDLDLFANDLKGFETLVHRIISRLRERFDPVSVVIREVSFCRLFVGAEQLKVEMVNDVPSHIGRIVEHPELGRLDSRENILANKITALVDRAHPKDIADIYFLLKDGLSLKQALTDADSKAVGITPLLIARILGEFSYDRLALVDWIDTVDIAAVSQYLKEVALTVVEGRGT
jgi:hypothetical protein